MGYVWFFEGKFFSLLLFILLDIMPKFPELQVLFKLIKKKKPNQTMFLENFWNIEEKMLMI